MTFQEKRYLSKGKLIGQPAELVSLIDYQEGSVVSREIISQDAGTVTLFAFDAGQGLSEHKTPFDAVVQILDGQAEVTIEGKNIHLKRGEMIIMPHNKAHSLKAGARFKMLLTMIRS
jgi:quercetin dioxygenase-like cupin family protein